MYFFFILSDHCQSTTKVTGRPSKGKHAAKGTIQQENGEQ